MNELATICIGRQVSALAKLYEVIETPEYMIITDLVTVVGSKEHNARILVAGVGKNSHIASKIADTMCSLGITAYPLNVSHLGHGDYGRICEDDLIIHISRSGTTREMLEAIDHIKLIKPRVNQVLIHCKKNKPKNQNVNIELFIGEAIEGDEFGLAPTTSTTALLCVLDCISIQASHNLGFKRLDFLKHHPDGALGAMLKAEQSKIGLSADELANGSRP